MRLFGRPGWGARLRVTAPLLALTSACALHVPEGTFSCAAAGDCPAGWACEVRDPAAGARCYRRSCDRCGPGQMCLGTECVCNCASCPDGCCDDNVCHRPATVGRCGMGGAACVTCAVGHACELGRCTYGASTRECAAPEPVCQDGACVALPSCAGQAPYCGPDGTDDCCATVVVPGGGL
ncbi:MAG: hypothetical protein HY906_25960 [Deltaproteobacteria bacterium]|nr:hypothetical protein [Deltaproteobacteria bacterium]